MYKYVVYLLILAIPSATRSQFYFYNDRYLDAPTLLETGVSVGGMNCLTDLGGNARKNWLKDLEWRNTQPTAGVYFSLIHEQKVGIRIEGNYGLVTAADSNLKESLPPARSRYERNLHFKSRIIEGLVILEGYPLHLFAFEKYSGLSPVLLLGIGLFSFNPMAKLDGKWYSLQPLGTEGQGEGTASRYKLTQVNIPVGVGLRYELSAILVSRLEIMYRLLFTDYLDDVSSQYVDPSIFRKYLDQADAEIARRIADRRAELGLRPADAGQVRGNPGNKDGFFSICLKVGIVINRKRR